MVAGGGLAGFSAAIAAARHGARTCLIQDRPVLGGNSSSEIRVTPHGAAAFHAYARETGIVGDALTQERARNHEKIEENGTTNSTWDMVLYDMAVRTPGLTLHLNTPVFEVVMDGPRRISAVKARVNNAETIRTISARAFVDATGDAVVSAMAGCEYRWGEEAFAEFQEPHAPQEASSSTMGNSLHFKTVDIGRPAPFTAPDWAVSYDDPDFFYKGGRAPITFKSGFWWIEIGTPFDTIHDNEEIRHELTRHLLGIWDFFKNKDPRARELTANLALDWVGQVPGKRENRRVMGKYLITENDLIAKTAFPDEIAYGGWYVDLHTIGGLLAGYSQPVFEPDRGEMSSYMGKILVGPYGLPLRTLISKDVDNLFMAGRNLSTTHAALGSIREMSTCALMGQAVGTGAALAIRDGLAFDTIHETVIEELQQTLLRDGCFLPNVVNTDAGDLARAATVTASSTDLLRGVGPTSADWLGGLDHWRDSQPVWPLTGKLDRRCAQWIALGADRRIDSLEVCLTNTADEAATVEAELYVVDSIWHYEAEPGEPLARATLTVPPRGPHWVPWQVALGDVAIPEGARYVRLQLSANENVEWHVAGALQPGMVGAYEFAPGMFRRFGGGSTLSFRVEPAQDCYPAASVQTGVTRPYRATNLWRSDPVVPLPAWIELTWPEPQTIREVQVTFAGNTLREYHAYPAHYRDPQCVRDYAIEAWVGGEWVELDRVTGNYHTRAVHTLPEAVTTERVRVNIHATNGDPSAGVYEIRAYGEPVCTPVR
ncbi:MAG TPA: FAD-dependent oxidoreductase [Pseudolysinimonas sp.]|nr:FAD-dependent oxidoreductase [Pseudolysinimonas sp.]